MPWTVSDVDKHKKGLSDKQKKQWVRIANSVYGKCLKKGDSEESCAASAIKQANGVIGNNSSYSAYKLKQEADYDVRIAVHQGKAHLIAPVVMMVEGVHNGSRGPLLHTIDELGKIPASWNGIPVVMDHPTDDEGTPISANSPDVLERVAVGQVFNTNVQGKRLRAEVWLDEEKLFEKFPETYEDIATNKVLEVSVGVFSDEEETEGDWNGEHYTAIAHNHRPDHLAILTEERGACSCEDGCGLGANAIDSEDSQVARHFFKRALQMGYSVSPIEINKGEGFNELMSMMYDKLRSMDTQKTYNYVEEMYDDAVIYTVSGDNNRRMYRQGYKVESGKIEFVGTPVEVHKKVEYVSNLSINNQREEGKMPNANECPKCLEKINALLANKESGFVEEDREWLNTLTEAQLDKVAPKVIEKTVEKTVEVNKLTAEDQAALEFGKRQLKERREKMIREIQDNAGKELWPDEKLSKMDDDVLERISKSVVKETVVDYSVGGAVVTHTASKEAPLLPAGVEIEPKK